MIYVIDINTATQADAANLPCDYPAYFGFNGYYYCARYKNAKQGYSYGVEAYAKQGFIGDALTLGVNYSYMKSKSYDRDENGNKVATRDFLFHPKHRINLSAVVIPHKDYSISLMGTILPRHERYTSTGTAYKDNTTEKVATVVYFDLEMAYQLTQKLTLSAGAYNLFDKDYIYNGPIAVTVKNPRQGIGIPGRRIFGGFEYRY